jgi:ribosome-binding protein aMBF1 (putative translation factor)
MLVVGTDASVKILNRMQAHGAAKKQCVVYYTTAVPQGVQSNCSEFDAFVSELEANPEDARRLKDANKWVAAKFYEAKEPTLAALRLAAGLSQRGLAAATGFEQSHISRYESGRIVPGTDIGSKLARALGVTLDEFEQARVRSRVSRNLSES